MAADETSTDESTDETSTDESTTDESTSTDDLGDAGKAALQSERRARRDAEKRAKATQDELDRIKAEQMTEQERAVAAARAEGATEAAERANRRLFAAEVKAAAVAVLSDPDLLSDPDVALRLLGFDAVPLDDGGDVDAAAIVAALDEFAERKPNLKASATRVSGSADGGTQGSGAPAQLSRDALKSMSPEEIDQAHREGRLNDLMSGKSRKEQ